MARNYKREYELYHSKPDQKKRRAARNLSRAVAKRNLGAKAIKGKDVDHKNHNPKDSSNGNLRVQSKAKNRSRNLGRGGRPKGS
jgi:hypothetical protein